MHHISIPLMLCLFSVSVPDLMHIQVDFVGSISR